MKLVRAYVGAVTEQPTSLPDVIAQSHSSAASEVVLLPMLWRKDLHVLLAEDQAVNREIAMAWLEASGCKVTAVENGLAALNAFRTQHFDAILMDCQMREMDGYMATECIRKLERERGTSNPIPIIALTAHTLKGDRERCLAAGMDDFLAKPFKRHDLHDCLARNLTVAQERREDLELSPAASPIGLGKKMIPTLDTSVLEALRQTGGVGDSGLVARWISMYLTEGNRLLDTIHQAIVNGDLPTLQAAAHSLRSTSGMVGALSLSQMSGEIEELAHQGNIDLLRLRVLDLQQEYAQVRQALGQILA